MDRIHSLFNTLRNCCCPVEENNNGNVRNQRRPGPRNEYALPGQNIAAQENRLDELQADNSDAQSQSGASDQSDGESLSGQVLIGRHGERVRYQLQAGRERELAQNVQNSALRHRRHQSEPLAKIVDEESAQVLEGHQSGNSDMESDAIIEQHSEILESMAPIAESRNSSSASSSSSFKISQLLDAICAVPEKLFHDSLNERLMELKSPNSAQEFLKMDAAGKVSLLSDVKNALATLSAEQRDYLKDYEARSLLLNKKNASSQSGHNMTSSNEDVQLLAIIESALDIVNEALTRISPLELEPAASTLQKRLTALQAQEQHDRSALTDSQRLIKKQEHFIDSEIREIEQDYLQNDRVLNDELKELNERILILAQDIEKKRTDLALRRDEGREKSAQEMANLHKEFETLLNLDQFAGTADGEAFLNACGRAALEEAVADRRNEILQRIEELEMMNSSDVREENADDDAEIQDMEAEIFRLQEEADKRQTERKAIAIDSDKKINALSLSKSTLRSDESPEKLLWDSTQMELGEVQKSLEKLQSLRS